jgi:tetratricopeptide (TPR) repeat protein
VTSSRSALIGTAGAALLLVACGALVVRLQIERERRFEAGERVEQMLYVSSPAAVGRMALSYDALAADLYWLRAVQHYGTTKLANDPRLKYELLYPLLDLTTSLDPYFNRAYRFGAIFLAEQPPAGPGRADLAIRLLEKGLAVQPTRWEFAYDLAFVYYWHVRDYPRAADWFQRAAAIPDAPLWLEPMAAVTLARGGDRATSRRLWTELVNSAPEDASWVRIQAEKRLAQLDAMDQIDILENAVKEYERRSGALPYTWEEMVRAGFLGGIPVDPHRFPYALNPYWGIVTLSEQSTLNPLPTRDDTSPPG